MSVLLENHKQVFENLRTNRSNFDAQWEEASERLIPAHVNSFFGRGYSAALTGGGQKNTELMYDSTAALALHRFSSVIESLSTPQSQQWHRLVPAEAELRKNRRVRLFLDEVNNRLFQQRYRPQANFVGQSQKVYVGYGAYGNGILFIDSPEDRTGLRYKSLHLGECYFMENHEGRVDSLYRAFFMNPRQIMQAFNRPSDTLPDSIQELAKHPATSEKEFEILHVIVPRADRDIERRDSKGMPFASLHFFLQENHLLRESGYSSFPAPITRYMQFANEVYGRGPAQMVLPSIKVLNEEKKTVLIQGHRVVSPVLLAYDDGIVGTFSMRPNAVNTGGVNAQGRPLVHPLPTGNLAVGQDLMEDERRIINDAFLITLFQILIETPQMTATEVLERAREKGMLVAPTVGRQQAEYHGPGIEREVDLLEQQGMLPPAPPELIEAGGGYRVEYDSPLSRMMRAEGASGFMRSLDTALQLIQVTQDPSPLDWFNLDAAMPAIQDINGAPTAWTNSIEAVQAIRAKRAQDIEDQKAIEAAPAMAGMIKSMSGQAA